jgi:signal transduction histidine kinase
VSDEGVGIARDARERIFEPFYSTKGDMGTGLGLWISRTIVKKQGGTIRFRSRPNLPRRGTIFSVTLRAAQAITAPGEFQQELGVEKSS